MPGGNRIELCGELVVELDGQRVEHDLPGRQGRLLFAFLALNHGRPVGRDAVVEALWEERPPADPRAALTVLVARLRRVLGGEAIAGRGGLTLLLGADIDVEEAARAAAEAERALADGDAKAAGERAEAALAVLDAPLLPGLETAWLDARRTEHAAARAAALELVAQAGLQAGPAGLRRAARAARSLIEAEPYRESGYGMLIRAHAGEGNVAEALQVYDQLRSVLRDELGIAPSAPIRALGERLLREEPVDLQPDAPLPLPAELSLPASSPMVGRGGELATLTAWCRGSAARLGCIAGEPGIGKSRLAAALAGDVMRDATVLYGRCDPDAPLPYQPFVEALRRLARPGIAPPVVDRELAELVPELGAAHTPASLDPGLRRHRLFEAVAGLLGDLAAARPMLLVADDAQWIDDSSVGLLRHLLRSPRTEGLRVLLTVRTPERDLPEPLRVLLAEAVRERAVVQVRLAGIGSAGVVELVRVHTSAQFLRTFHAHTGGNPLFVEETLRALRDAGLDPTEESLALVGVPDGVRAVIARRLELLGGEVEPLRLAAVAGSHFEIDLLEAAAERPHDVLGVVERAVDAGLVVEHPDGSLAFTHAIVREALLAPLLVARLARLHRRLAEALQARGAPAVELVRHWDGAGDAERAFDASVAAGHQVAEQLDFAAAAAHFERALDLRPELDDAVVLAAAADAARWAGDPGRAAELARRAIAVAGPDDTRVGALTERLSRYLWEMGEWAASLAASEEAAKRVSSVPDSPERARVLAALARALMLRERYAESAAACEKALAAARAVGARVEEADSLITLGVDLALTGRLDVGLRALREALAIAQETRSLEAICRAHVNLSEALLRAGQTHEALEVALAGVGITREAGLVATGGAIVTANAIAALVRLGRWHEAETLSDEVLAAGVPEGLAAELLALRVAMFVARGEPARAHAELPAAVAAASGAYQPSVVVALQVARAELALLDGDYEAARKAIASHVDSVDGDILIRLCACGLRVAAESGDDGEHPRALIAAARDAAARLGDGLLREAAAHLATAEADWSRISGAENAQSWRAAAEAWEQLGHPLAAARARRREELVGDPSHANPSS